MFLRWIMLFAMVHAGCAEETGALNEAAPMPKADSGHLLDAMSPLDGAPTRPTEDVSTRDQGILDEGPEFIALVGPSAQGLAARVNQMDVPIDPASARRAGCLINGLNVGSGPSNVIALGGGFGAQIEPDQNGIIPLLLLFMVQEWAEGLSASQLTTVNLSFGRGVHGPEETFELSSEKISYLDLAVEGGWFETSATPFTLPISLLNSPTVPLALTHLRVRGRLGMDAKGMRIDHGTMVGYITQDSLLDLLSAVRVICEADTPIGICLLIGAQLDQPDGDLLSLAAGFMGGYDTRLDGQQPSPCDATESEECNGISACMVFSAVGVPLVME